MFGEAALHARCGARLSRPSSSGAERLPSAKPPMSAEAAKRALSELQRSLGKAVRNFTVLENRDWVYARQGTTLMGRQLLLSYKHAGVVFDKRIIVLPRFEGTVVHVWSYTAPRAQYSSLHPKAERILRSWTILP